MTKVSLPFLVLVFLTLMPSPSRADFSDAAIAAISRVESQGFVIDTVSRTFLGRVKVVSHNEDYDRETVFHSVTIEVLQDRLTPRAGPSRNGSQTQSGVPTSSNGSNGAASSNAESSIGDSRSSTSGSATGRSPQSTSSSESSHSESASTTNNPDGSTTTTTSSTTTSSASSSASAGN